MSERMADAAVCELCLDSTEDLQRVPVVFEDEREAVIEESVRDMRLCSSCREECAP